MNARGNIQREKWLSEAIAELEHTLHSKNHLCNDAINRILREYKDELKELKKKGEQSPLNSM